MDEKPSSPQRFLHGSSTGSGPAEEARRAARRRAAGVRVRWPSASAPVRWVRWPDVPRPPLRPRPHRPHGSGDRPKYLGALDIRCVSGLRDSPLRAADCTYFRDWHAKRSSFAGSLACHASFWRSTQRTPSAATWPAHQRNDSRAHPKSDAGEEPHRIAAQKGEDAGRPPARLGRSSPPSARANVPQKLDPDLQAVTRPREFFWIPTSDFAIEYREPICRHQTPQCSQSASPAAMEQQTAENRQAPDPAAWPEGDSGSDGWKDDHLQVWPRMRDS